MKLTKKFKQIKEYHEQVIAIVIAILSTTLVASSVTRASDIDIYQQARSGDITLMLMLDISGSMDTRSISEDYGISNSCGTDTAPGGYSRSYCSISANSASALVKDPDAGCTLIGSTYRCYDRISRLKDGVFDLLQGNASKGIVRLGDEKIIGLSTLGVYTNTYYNTGRILVPARALGTLVGSQTQRDTLLSYVRGLSASTNTPTARSYAETVSYLMGTTTASRQLRVSNMPYFRTYTYLELTWGGYVQRVQNQKCNLWNSTYTSCASNGWVDTNETIPVGSAVTALNCTFSANGNFRTGICYNYTGIVSASNSNSGFSYSLDPTKNNEKTLYISPSSLTQTEEIKQCSGQGVYVLTDGEPTQDTGSLPLMQAALGSKGQSFSCDDSGSWDCLNKLALTLLNPDSNPANLKFKTAVVGFGKSFNDVPSYSKNLTQEENIANLGTINTNVKRAAYWGIIGEGGWYSGSSSQDVVNSVNAFINSLSTDIPAVTTGSPTIPRDALNPSQLQIYAYYPQFQPTPDKSYQLWAGNLKKYKVDSTGKLVDKNGNPIVNELGRIIDNYDLWAPGVNEGLKDADETTYGSRKFALMGGVKSQLLLKATTANTANRKLLTNRIATGTGTSATFTGSNTSLRAVDLNYLTDTTYRNDPNRGYLISLLGYAVDATQPNTITSTTLANADELRQVGAVMHSSPLLITNKGKLTYTNNTLGSTNREDYVLFGTTQGLLHVVDATTGKEKFAFVPNEMVENQKEAFLKNTTTNGTTNKLFYGIDGPWTAYTEYVPDSSGNLTVNTGKASQQGKQYVYGGLRMGGRSYYALDLRDINNPKLQFHIDPATQKVYYNGSSTTFSQLGFMGQSWSKPAVTWVNWGGTRKMVMFVGGGYDAGGVDGDARDSNGVKGIYSGFESDTYNQSNSRGAGVYMFDAINGNLLWWASKNATQSSATTTSGVIGLRDDNLKYSVVSEIRTIDRDADGLADHLYFGDLGGQVFRIDINNQASTIGSFAKTPRRLLNLNAAEKSPRFYDPPAFSVYNYNGTKFAVISIGSGNRSQPLKDYTVGSSGYDYDAIYNIYDKDVGRKDLYSTNTFNTENITTVPTVTNSLKEITDATRNNNTTLVAPYSTKGWFYRFKSQKLQSEKVMGTPVAMNYKLYVSTFDSSKDGLSGDCGAGVKGESFISGFCLPYGQCAMETVNRWNLGAGIQTVTIGDQCVGASCGSTGGGVDGGGPGGGGGGSGGGGNNNPAKNSCIATGGRILILPSGNGPEEETQICLVPQRWYEKFR